MMKLIPKRRPWSLVLLFGLFLLPTLIAWSLYFGGWQPPMTSNHGTLIEPPHRLDGTLRDEAGAVVPLERLHGQWSLLISSQGACGADCQERLLQTRQVRLALANEADRVQRVLILPREAPALSDTLRNAHPDLVVYRSDSILPPSASTPAAQLHVSLLDSRGYRMMRYPEPLDAQGLLDDLDHLLDLSNLDLEQLQGLTGDR